MSTELTTQDTTVVQLLWNNAGITLLSDYASKFTSSDSDDHSVDQSMIIIWEGAGHSLRLVPFKDLRRTTSSGEPISVQHLRVPNDACTTLFTELFGQRPRSCQVVGAFNSDLSRGDKTQKWFRDRDLSASQNQEVSIATSSVN